MGVASEPGRGIGCYLAPGESAENQIDQFISYRHVQRIRNESEGRLRESLRLRRDGMSHTYPMHEHDLGTMRTYHEQVGEIPLANWFYAWWRSLIASLGRR